MSLIQIKPVNQEKTVEVEYLGGVMDVPASHEWVAITKRIWAGVIKYYITSFANKPTVHNGLVLPVDGDFVIHNEVEPVDSLNSVRRVQGHSAVEAVEHNKEELLLRIAQVVKADDISTDEKVELLMDKDNGIFLGFMRTQISNMQHAIAEAVKEAAEQDAGQAVPQQTNAKEVDTADALTAELTAFFEAQGIKVIIK